MQFYKYTAVAFVYSNMKTGDKNQDSLRLGLTVKESQEMSASYEGNRKSQNFECIENVMITSNKTDSFVYTRKYVLWISYMWAVVIT